MKLFYSAAICAAFATVSMASLAQADDTLRLGYWQSPNSLNPYRSAAYPDRDAASLVLEPLAVYGPDGVLVPRLAVTIPTVENGDLSAEGDWVIWRLRDDLTWSDGTPLTSADVAFTVRYASDPETASAATAPFDEIARVETPDAQTVKLQFQSANVAPRAFLVSAAMPILQAAQFETCLGKPLECAEADLAPIGTGPYMVETTRAGDLFTFLPNPNYRDAGTPPFGRVIIKGGGDAVGNARAVLQTGEFDFAANIQVAPDVLAAMTEDGQGSVQAAFGSFAERVMLNMSNPDPALGDARSTAAHAHPAFSDPAVRKAIALSIDRSGIADVLYGASGRATCNFIVGPDRFVSPTYRDCKEPDLAQARAVLDEAGWLPGPDGIREKDGVRLSFTYQTSTNAIRQDTQAILKQTWSEIGIETNLENFPASVFFGDDTSSPDTLKKFYADFTMYFTGFEGTEPGQFFERWTCGEIPSPDSLWRGWNTPRFCDPDYDAKVAALKSVTDPAARSAAIIELNDWMIEQNIIISLVHRATATVISDTIEGYVPNGWDSSLWNIIEWRRVPGAAID